MSLNRYCRGEFDTHKGMCESPNSNSHGGAFPIWIRHVTAAPIGVIVVSGLPQEMDHQCASMRALTNNVAHSCNSSDCRRPEGLHSEDGQCCGIEHEIVGAMQVWTLPRFPSRLSMVEISGSCIISVFCTSDLHQFQPPDSFAWTLLGLVF